MVNKMIRKNDCVIIPQINDTCIYVGEVTKTRNGDTTVKFGNRMEGFDSDKLEKIGVFKKYKGQMMLAPGTVVRGNSMQSQNIVGLILNSLLQYDSSELGYHILTDIGIEVMSGHGIMEYCQGTTPFSTYSLYDNDNGLEKILP